MNLPLTELTGETLALAAPDKDAPIVLACDYSFQPVRLIAMTMQAYPVLKAQGYKNIYRLNLWQSADKSKMFPMEEIEKAVPFEGTVAAPSPSAPEPDSPPVMCTMDAKECPDGSYVSRTGPNCAFAECPSPK